MNFSPANLYKPSASGLLLVPRTAEELKPPAPPQPPSRQVRRAAGRRYAKLLRQAANRKPRGQRTQIIQAKAAAQQSAERA